MKKRIFIILGVLILTVAKGASAEENRSIDRKAIELEPITVTASRTARMVSESPASVSIVSNQDIAQTNAKSVADLLKDIEGVYMYDPTTGHSSLVPANRVQEAIHDGLVRR